MHYHHQNRLHKHLYLYKEKNYCIPIFTTVNDIHHTFFNICKIVKWITFPSFMRAIWHFYWTFIYNCKKKEPAYFSYHKTLLYSLHVIITFWNQTQWNTFDGYYNIICVKLYNLLHPTLGWYSSPTCCVM